MEPENQNNQPVEVTTQSQPVTESDKMSKKGIIGMVILTVVALAGVAFGIWGMVGKDQAEKDLAIKITEAGGKVTDFVTDKITSIDEDGTVTEITDTNVTTSSVNSEDYIYVGEWGLKFKIPENLEMISYFVRNWDEDNYAGTSLCVTGATTGHDGSPSFVKNMIEDSLHVCLGKNTKSLSEDEGGVLYQTIPAGEYYFTGPQAIFGDGSDADWEVESVNVIKAMLNDNRSSI